MLCARFSSDRRDAPSEFNNAHLSWPFAVTFLLATARSRHPPNPLRNSKKQSWLRLTVLPSASTSAPPTPASASGSMIGTSTLPDPLSRREKKARLPPPRDRPARARDRAAPPGDATRARSEHLARPPSTFLSPRFRLERVAGAPATPVAATIRREKSRRSWKRHAAPRLLFFPPAEPETDPAAPPPILPQRRDHRQRPG